MSKEDFKKLKEIAKVGVIVDDKTQKVKRKIDEINYNNLEIESHLKKEKNFKKDLLHLIKNKSSRVTIKNKIQEFEDYNNRSLNLIEIDDIENNINQLNWNEYLESSKSYAEKYNLDLDNPYISMSSNIEMSILSKELIEKYDIKDLEKDDIIVSSVAGALAGIIDVFLIGTISADSNENKVLVNVTDKTFEKMVMKYAKHQKIGEYKENIKNASTTEAKEKLKKKMNDFKKEGFKEKKKAISYLENKFKVNYDDATKATIFEKTNFNKLTPNNHHFRSLAHDPSPLGLLVGVFDQLDNKTTLINDFGEIERVHKAIKNADKERISNISNGIGPKNIVDAITNWFGHIMSDISGSNSSKGRGSGLPVPFTSILGKLNFGGIKVEEGNKIVEKTIGELVEKMFKSGYDIRAFTAQLIPVIVYETIIRAYWFYKHYFINKNEFSKSIPIATEENYDLARMLLIGAGSFSLIDVGHATIKAGIPPKPENIITFLLTINYPGLINLGVKAYQNIKYSIKRDNKINEMLDKELRKEIDDLL